MKYFVSTKGKDTTYKDKESFEAAIQSGKISKDGIFWHAGMKEWQSIRMSGVLDITITGTGIRDAFSRAKTVLTDNPIGMVKSLVIFWAVCFVTLLITCLPLVWVGTSLFVEFKAALHSLVAGSMEQQLVVDISKDPREWHILSMGKTETVAGYELVPDQEPNNSELLTIQLYPTTIGIQDFLAGFAKALEKAEGRFVERKTLQDGSEVCAYSTNAEQGYVRVLQGSDGLYVILHTLKPESVSPEKQANGQALVKGASLQAKGAPYPAGGLDYELGTSVTKELYQKAIELAFWNVPIGGPIIFGVAILISLISTLLMQSLMYFFARCASGEIGAGDWQEVFSGLSAWKVLIRYNIIATVCLSIGFLLCYFPGVYLAIATFYAPIVAIEASKRSYKGKTSAWAIFWQTRRNMSGNMLSLFLLMLVCGCILVCANFIFSFISPILLLLLPILQFLVLIVLCCNYRAIFPLKDPPRQT